MGDYFLLLHDDDLIDNDFVQACMQAADHQKGSGLIRTGTRIIDSAGIPVKERLNDVIGLSTEDFFCGWFSGQTSLYLCSTLFHTGYLKAIGGFSSKHNLFQDVVAEVQLAAARGRVDLKSAKASFRKHEGEMTFGVNVKAWCEDSLELLDLMCCLATKKKEKIRQKGQLFFCNLNFKRAMAVTSLTGRIEALLTVLKQFQYRRFALHRFVRCLRQTIDEVRQQR
jgi:hypothetical protein